jgi:NADH dehydrogenase FAD-containing subunit
VLIIGGGLTGIELVSEVAEAYPQLNVTLSTRGTFGHSLSVQGADYVRAVFSELGIHLCQQCDVARLAPGKAYTRSGDEIPFDACLWAGAFRVSPLAQQSGLPVDAQGRVLVDASLRSVAFPNIYAVGDAASTPLRMACATALPMGAYAGGHLAAQLSERPLPGAFSFAYLLQCISLGRHRALV